MLIELPPVINGGEEMEPLKAAIAKRARADDAHVKPREGHVLEVKTGAPCGMRCERLVCCCGWTGDWRRSTPA